MMGLSPDVQRMLDESFRRQEAREAWRRESLLIDLWMGTIISGLCVLGWIVSHL
jgi:hypothetical protein